MPGIYFHSLLGSRNWTAGVAKTGRARSVNREKLNYEDLQAELKDPASLRYHVFRRYCDLIRLRIQEPAFHPNGRQDVLALNDGLFAVRRTSPDGSERIVAVHNVSGKLQTLSLKPEHLGAGGVTALTDLLTGEQHDWQPGLTLTLDPYEVMWLKLQG